MVNYIPTKGDIVLVDLNPTKGHEQKGYRPALVISTKIFNEFSKMCMVLPITTNTKYFPTHYLLSDSKMVKGSVLCEHVRSIDYNSRKIKFIEKASDNDLLSVFTLFIACIE